ncbi:hypothetical protein BpHYR1_024323, partial [Brachionus plicatilis]
FCRFYKLMHSICYQSCTRVIKSKSSRIERYNTLQPILYRISTYIIRQKCIYELSIALFFASVFRRRPGIDNYIETILTLQFVLALSPGLRLVACMIQKLCFFEAYHHYLDIHKLVYSTLRNFFSNLNK